MFRTPPPVSPPNDGIIEALSHLRHCQDDYRGVRHSRIYIYVPVGSHIFRVFTIPLDTLILGFGTYPREHSGQRALN